MQKGRQRKKGEKDAQELHQFFSARNKKHCVREWQLVSSDTRRVRWETRQTSVAGVAEHQSSVSVCLFLPARTEPWHDLREGFRAFDQDFRALCFRSMLERIWTCCYFWLNTVCDVETPLVAAFRAVPLPAATGCVWAMVLTEKQSITQMRGCDWMGG